MNTNRSGTKTVTVPKARSLMHKVYQRAYAAGRAAADKPLPSDDEQLRERLKVIKEELQA